MKGRFSLLRKVQFLFAAILIGFGLVTAVSVSLLARNAVRDQVKRDVELASTYLLQFMGQQRGRLDLQTRLIAEQPSLRAICADSAMMKQPETLSDRLSYYTKMTGTQGLAFFDRQGQLFCKLGTTPPDLSSVDIDSLMFLPPMAQGLVRSVQKDSRGFMLTTTAPIKVGVQVVGAVTAYHLIGRDTAIMVAQSLGIDVAFQLGDGTIISSLQGLDSMVQDRDFHQATIKGQAYGYQVFSLSVQGSDAVLSAAALRSEAEATMPYRTFTRVFFVLLGVAVVVAMLLATHFAKGVTKPLASVVTAATTLQAGEWPDQLEITSNDEVGILQAVFNETVSSLRRAQERLLTMLETDPLTELPNHRKFKETLAKQAEVASQTQRPFAVLLVDIDHFKRHNEALGMEQGDESLHKVSRLIQKALPARSVLARFGGEEFAVILPDTDMESAAVTAEKVRNAVESCDDLGLTVSIGSAQFGVNTSKAEGMIIAAELALSRAKQLGRNQVCMFDSVPGAQSDADPYQLYRYMQDASLATIQALAAAVDAKDPYTEGHSRRVAQYAQELAEYIGLAQADLDLVYRTGTLHDVGKIGVPDSILKKPSHLTEDERAIMKTHPVLGELIVRKAPQLEDTIPGVRHHHEAWDGNGYPDQLKGEDIPFIARLLAIADSYDAMTSDRPYRKGMSEEVALGEILKGAGSQFEPGLAKSFVELMRKKQSQAA